MSIYAWDIILNSTVLTLCIPNGVFNLFHHFVLATECAVVQSRRQRKEPKDLRELAFITASKAFQKIVCFESNDEILTLMDCFCSNFNIRQKNARRLSVP